MFDKYDLLLVVQSLVYILICPFTKVEESFNTQATYDLLHKNDLDSFDHIDFPGVVPRTFLGPILLSVLAKPFLFVFNLSGKYELIFVRIIMMLIHIFINSYFRKGIKYRFGKKVSRRYAIFQFIQFHISFYHSRPLPNSFALILTNLAAAFFVRNHITHCFVVLTYCTVMFRSEIALFAACVGLSILMFHPVKNLRKMWTLTKSFLICFCLALPFSIIFSVLIDSFFWKRFLWPEGEVLYYNTYLNKSHHWGTQPFIWYFVSSLPRSLLGAQLFTLPSMVVRGRGTRLYYFSAYLFVFLYSFLPHKELRFVFYAIPVLNMANAIGFVSIENIFYGQKVLDDDDDDEDDEDGVDVEDDDQKTRSRKELVWRFLKPCIIGGSFLLTFVFLEASRTNYYGGDALERFHEYLDEKNNEYDEPISLHISTHATMTGISQFLYRNDGSIIYSKNEVDPDFHTYDYILTGSPEQHKESYEVVGIQSGFARTDLKDWILSWFRGSIFKSEDKLWLMKNMNKISSTSENETETEKEEEEEYEEEEMSDEEKKRREVEDKILGYDEKKLETLRVPVMKWYQKRTKLVTNMVFYDAPAVKYVFKKHSFTLVSELFRARLVFWHEIDTKKSYVKIRNDKIVVVAIKKRPELNWPRLLKQEETPDYLKIDWDEWDDEFNIEIKDRMEDAVEDFDPEASGYRFEFGESFVKTFKEKVDPDKTDKEREIQSQKSKYQKEDFTPFLSFLETERKKVEKVREDQREAEEKRERATWQADEEKEKRRREYLEKQEKMKRKEREHESKQLSDLVLRKAGILGDDEDENEEIMRLWWERVYGKVNPFVLSVFVFIFHVVMLGCMVTTIRLSPRIKLKKE